MANLLRPVKDQTAPSAPKQEESASPLVRIWQDIKRDATREVQNTLQAFSDLRNHASLTYEHKLNVVKQDKQILGTGVTLETGQRRTISWRLHGKPQLGIKRYGLTAATLSTPKTRLIGAGPYLEGQVEIAGTGDISLRHKPTMISAANVDARLNEKLRGGIQVNLLGQKAKLYVEVQNGHRTGFGYNRPFNLAPEMDGIAIVGELSDHALKLRLPTKPLIQITPPSFALHMAGSVVRHVAEAFSVSDAQAQNWKDPKKPADVAIANTQQTANASNPVQPVQPKTDSTLATTPYSPKPIVKERVLAGWQQPSKPPTHAEQSLPDYTVKKGDTLWDIARANSSGKWTYLDLAKANKDQVKNPDLIFPGQRLHIPQQ